MNFILTDKTNHLRTNKVSGETLCGVQIIAELLHSPENSYRAYPIF